MVNLKRAELLQEKTIKPDVAPLASEMIRRLDFTLSHLLLSSGKTVAVTASGNGRLVYEYARLRPQFNFIGVDYQGEKIERARKFFSLGNLQFVQGETQNLNDQGVEIDAILNVGSFHQLYSHTGYNKARVVERLKKQLDSLPIGGQIVIQDYFTPESDQKIVFLEVPKQHDNDNLARRSPADLLIDFSQRARPLDTSGGQGFLLEEEDPHHAGTRLFRLPYKWAVEFLYRVHDYDHWDQNLEQEYTIFSLDDWQKEINGLGARVTYSTPYYRDDLDINQGYGFYDEQGVAFETPPRGFICVIEKVKPTEPLYISERRSSVSEKIKMSVETEIDEDTDQTINIVKHHRLTDDLLPWRTDGEGNILVTVRTGVPRPVINASSRGVPNLDGKKWAGFLTEPIVMPVETTIDAQEKIACDVLKEFLNIGQENISSVRKEAQYYPKPEFLVQRLRGFTARLKNTKDLNLENQKIETEIFQEINEGRLIELYASDVLKAIHVGLIPDSRLEILIMQLMNRIGVSTDDKGILESNWEDILEEDIDVEDAIDEEEWQAMEEDRNDYITADLVVDSVKHMRSVFVKQGNMGGLLTSIETVEEEFILPLDATTNTVVCFPLSVDSTTGIKVVGVEPKKMSVPSRLDGQTAMVQLPSLQLSNDVKTLHQLHEFLAEKFDCDLKNIKPMGSSFFACPEISPERVYPFAILNPGKGAKINLKNAPMDVIKSMMRNIKPHGRSSGVALFKGMRDLGEWYQGGVDNDLKIGATDMLERKTVAADTPPPKSEQSYEPK